MQKISNNGPEVRHEIVTADGRTHLFGDPALRSALDDKHVKMVLSTPVSKVDIVFINNDLRVYGPAGGDNRAYELMGWCIRNTAVFGFSIENINGEDLPVFIFKDRTEMRRAFKALRKLKAPK